MADLIIDKDSYPLDDKKYFKNVYDKKQIVIGHTFTNNMNHYIGWNNRYNGKYKRTAAFTIDLDGNVYQHYDPKYYSNFVNVKDVDEHIIGITLINEGWLIRNTKTNDYFNYLNEPYNGEVIKQKWRGHSHWVPYNDKQIASLTNLCEYLSKEYGVELKSLGHNTRLDSIYDYDGIVSRSNYKKEFTDLSPAFDFNTFKNKLKEKNTTNE